MLKNYFKAAFRNLFKEKIFSILNIVGLATGITAFMLIMQYVETEKSYENFIPANDQIYRVTLSQYVNNELSIESAENYPGVGPALLQELPEVENYSRLYNMGYKNNLVITYDDGENEPIKFKHRKFLYADSAFLPMMGYEMVMGDAETALVEPLSTVISETYAKKYFGDANPLGKMLRLQDDDFNDELAKVTGVFKDLPENTHLKFDVLYSYETLMGRGDWAPGRYHESWQRADMYTYVRLRAGTDPITTAPPPPPPPPPPRFQLIGQYLLEAAVINFVAIVLASLLIVLVLPIFNELSGHNFIITDLLTGSFLFNLSMIWLIGSALSGIYPAILMSGFIPVVVLKGKGASKGGGGFLRKALVIFQFATSIALIAGTYIDNNL